MTRSARQLDRDIDEQRARHRLLQRVRKVLDKWEPILGVQIHDVRVRKMKSYWASINEPQSRMWVAADLAKLPPRAFEYAVVHELVHLRTDGHDAKFNDLLDRHLPGWRIEHANYAGPMTRHS